jgi:formylglycine-generating enzyme
MRSAPICSFFAVFCVFHSWLSGMGCIADETSKQLGVALDPAITGPCVPIDSGKGGYMIPYSQSIGESGVSFDMVPVPGGIIRVGSLETSPTRERGNSYPTLKLETEVGRSNDEGPCFEVELSPYWVGKTEVTWKQYECFMRMDGYLRKLASAEVRKVIPNDHPDAITVPTQLYAESHHRELSSSGDHPAVTMTQYAAKQYTKWLSKMTGDQYRLPTEAEWEHAARAGSQAAYCFGDDIEILEQYAVYDPLPNSQTEASVVASKKPNAFGIHDMHGNVWEWTIEHYSDSGYAKQDRRRFVGFEGTQWPTSIDSQCVRGGCWNDPPSRLRAAARMGSDKNEWAQEDPECPTSPWWYTSDPSRMVGMRIVRSLDPLEDDLISQFWEIHVQELQDDVHATVQEGRGRMGLANDAMLRSINAPKPRRK